MTICTIVIPTHNREDLLVRAVRSALKACPLEGEVLVVDDKSIVPAFPVLSCIQDPRLRVISNKGRSGAASSRNLGVSLAAGECIFFLDDDDEIVADYCSRILDPGGGASSADWGFSSIVERRGGAQGDVMKCRKRLLRGVAPHNARVRDKVAAMSDGFWIRRSCFIDAGGLDPEQTIDEDTDLCMRLYARKFRPWYESSPGMVVYKGYVPARANGTQLTVATPAPKGLACYRRTHDKYLAHGGSSTAAQWFLATRYIRRAVKTGFEGDAFMFAKSQLPWWWAFSLLVMVWFKRLVR